MTVSLSRVAAELRASLGALAESVDEARVAIVEDRPRFADVVLVDRLEEAIEDLAGQVREMQAAAIPLAPGGTLRADGFVVALLAVQAALVAATVGYWERVRAHEALDDLIVLAAKRRGEWQAWLGSVRDAVATCAGPLARTAAAVLLGWEDLYDPLTQVIAPEGAAPPQRSHH